MQPLPQDQPDESIDRPAAGIDAATLDLSILDGLAGRPLQEHAEVYDQVHVQLQGALREIDDA